MKDFIKSDLDISKIVLAVKVVAPYHQKTHINRPSHGLAMHFDGRKIYHFSDGTDLEVLKNDIIFMPKRSNYTVEVFEGSDCYAINFDFFEDKDFKPFVFHPKNPIVFLEGFRTASHLFQYKRYGYIKGCKSELYKILYNMEKELGLSYVGKGKQLLIAPAVEYIHENYSDPTINSQKIAQISGITPTYFRHIFKKNYMVTPNKYINNLRISKAKSLLENTDYTIDEISYRCGYRDYSYFSKAFSKSTGISPSEYRKKNNTTKKEL